MRTSRTASSLAVQQNANRDTATAGPHQGVGRAGVGEVEHRQGEGLALVVRHDRQRRSGHTVHLAGPARPRVAQHGLLGGPPGAARAGRPHRRVEGSGSRGHSWWGVDGLGCDVPVQPASATSRASTPAAARVRSMVTCPPLVAMPSSAMWHPVADRLDHELPRQAVGQHHQQNQRQGDQLEGRLAGGRRQRRNHGQRQDRRVQHGDQPPEPTKQPARGRTVERQKWPGIHQPHHRRGGETHPPQQRAAGVDLGEGTHQPGQQKRQVHPARQAAGLGVTLPLRVAFDHRPPQTDQREAGHRHQRVEAGQVHGPTVTRRGRRRPPQ